MEKLAEETGNVNAQIFIEDWKVLATEEQWREFRPLPLISDLIINFAEDIASYFKVGKFMKKPRIKKFFYISKISTQKFPIGYICIIQTQLLPMGGNCIIVDKKI